MFFFALSNFPVHFLPLGVLLSILIVLFQMSNTPKTQIEKFSIQILKKIKHRYIITVKTDVDNFSDKGINLFQLSLRPALKWYSIPGQSLSEDFWCEAEEDFQIWVGAADRGGSSWASGSWLKGWRGRHKTLHILTSPTW